ncbi:acriflavin resistance protein [Anaerobacillus alkalidiazotrophicus]|uniref:Acriflavin resistance protein n=1 Tax=Anaerobacillus alkalidiazotrophicus TaxID=472963 RepID=A0A1S2MA17_9BACI|nr:efflux RND transporter permease subunit [Anaerobacillus alkalidiazotrophicus]OIJ21454.1 acriflavin resistance protein [Anaerobacillus alkalidiazotrophicus]
MSLLRLLMSRKKIVGLMVVFILIIGMYGAGKLDRELFPTISFDGAQVYVNAGQMSTLDVEEEVTKPIERILNNISGIKHIQSTSSIGVSLITVQAEEGLGEEVFKEIETTMIGLENQLSGVNFISTYQFSTKQPYEFYMTIKDGPMDKMTEFAKQIVKPRIEALPEVREVSLEGIENKEVIVELDLNQLQDLQLSPQQVVQIINQANIDTSIATLEGESGRPTVRWTTSLSTIDNVKSIEIPTVAGIKQLSKIAKVYEENNTTTSVGWNNGTREFIFVKIGRTSDVTQVEMAASVRKELEKINEEGLVNDFVFEELVAQADYVTDTIEGVSTNVMLGGIIALLVLILFLRNFRATFIIGLSIPLSILLTFIGMWLFDYSFNILTLIGLGLGIGMMVDSSIVILESIYRKKEEGYKKLDAVLAGVKEVATAVIASMLTTIVVFVPIGLLGGEIGQFMIVLSIIVVITLVSSVIVAFTLIPTLSENFLKLKNKKHRRQEGRIVINYGRLISWVSRKKRNRYSIIVIFLAVFISSLLLITKIPMTVMPDVLNRYAEIMVQLERGLTPTDREEIAIQINKALNEIDDVENNLIMDNVDAFFVLINMTPEETATLHQTEVNERINRGLRELQKDYPIQNVGTADFSGLSFPVIIEIKGEEFESLDQIANELELKLTSVEGLVGITSSSNKNMAEELIEFKYENMKKDSVTAAQLFSQMQDWSIRIPAGELKQEDLQSPIFVTTNVNINNKKNLLKQKIATINGNKNLSTYLRLVETKVPTEVTRKDGERMITVFADIEGRDLGSINREIEEVLKNYEAPVGYSITTAGSLQEQKEAQQDMLIILGIAIFLVYVVMTVQFNSFLHPVIVMSIIPLTVTGALFGLLLTQSELSILSGLGMVFLIGIVLNNAILFIDRTNQLRVQGYQSSEALVEAGKNRLRPIFMTSLTTAGGMLPLAIATGTASNYQSPLAIVIISGLLFATFITLLLIPSVYLLFEDIKNGLSRLLFRKPKRRNMKRDIALDK